MLKIRDDKRCRRQCCAAQAILVEGDKSEDWSNKGPTVISLKAGWCMAPRILRAEQHIPLSLA